MPLLHLILLFALLLLSGCQKGVNLPQQKSQDDSLAKVSDLKFIPDFNAIAFEWTPVSDTRVSNYALYRSNPEKNDGKLYFVTKIADRYSSHYVDTKLKANTKYNYTLFGLRQDGVRAANGTSVNATTLPALESVSYFVTVDNLPRLAKLIWRPHTNQRVNSYKLERKEISKPEWKSIATIKNRLQAEYIDKGLKDNNIYYYRLKALTYDNIISLPSKTVTVSTKPIPNPVQNIHASRNLSKRIEITWAKSLQDDITHYNVYASDDNDQGFKKIASTNEPKFVENIATDGVQRFYKVTAIEKNGLEGSKNVLSAAGNTLVPLIEPAFTESVILNSEAHLKWKNGDTRTQRYVLIKTSKENMFKSKVQQININSLQTSFVDPQVLPGITYEYKIIAMDKFGIQSKPSASVELFFAPKE